MTDVSNKQKSVIFVKKNAAKKTFVKGTIAISQVSTGDQLIKTAI